MYAFASSEFKFRGSIVKRAEDEQRAILDLREKAIASRDFLYCSPIIKHLIEEEIPRLIARMDPAKI